MQVYTKVEIRQLTVTYARASEGGCETDEEDCCGYGSKRYFPALSLHCPIMSGVPARGYDLLPLPYYLEKYYWWSYARRGAVRFWDRTWLLNLILYGNFSRLREAALVALGSGSGRTLQIACCYGDLTSRLAARVARAGGYLDVIDVLSVQLDAVRQKLAAGMPVRPMLMDASALAIPDRIYDCVLIFFLFHEEPQEYRVKTIRDALRVAKPHGRIVIVDFAKPRIWHPIRLWLPVLDLLEPFAAALWKKELSEIMPEEIARRRRDRKTYFGGLFQILAGR